MRIRPTGFSLIEMVMVLVLMAIFAAIAVPHYIRSLQIYEINLAAQRIVSDLAMAQSRANQSSTSVTLSFNTTSSSYQIVGLAAFDTPASTYTVNLANNPYFVTLTSVNFNGASQAVFNGYGTPTQGGTIVITLGTLQHTITVDGTSGRAVIQ